MIEPIDGAGVVTKPPDSDAWGISVTAPGHAAHAALGTATDVTTQKPTGFATWR